MDEVPKGYKKTEIGILPEDWKVVPIVDCCMFERGTEPGSKSYNRKGKGILFIRVGNIAKGQQELVYTTSKKVKLCKSEDILLALDGSPGAVAKGWEGAYASGIRKVSIKDDWKNKINYQFVYYILQHDIVQKIIKEHTTGVTILHASKSLNYIKIPLPPLEEQKQIAKILDTIREAIELQDRAIEAWKRIKKSAMAKLFTEGLYGEGLKETEIGEMPKSWKVVRLGGVFEVQQGKQLSKKRKIKKGEIKCKFLRTSNVFWGFISLRDLDTMYVSKEELQKLKVKKWDIFVCEGGEVGKTAILEEDINFDLIYQNHLHRLRPKFEGIEPKFFVYWMEKHIKLNKAHIPANVTTIPNLSASRLKSFEIPLPPLEEQKQIAKILSTIDKKIEIEKKRKEVLQKMFKSMLHLLMTGKIRVKEVEI